MFCLHFASFVLFFLSLHAAKLRTSQCLSSIPPVYDALPFPPGIYVAELVLNQRWIGSRAVWVRAGAASTASCGTCHTKPEAPNALFDVVTKVWIIYSKSERGWISQHKCFLKVVACGHYAFVLFFLPSLFIWGREVFLCLGFLFLILAKTLFYLFFFSEMGVKHELVWVFNGFQLETAEYLWKLIPRRSLFLNQFSHICAQVAYARILREM